MLVFAFLEQERLHGKFCDITPHFSASLTFTKSAFLGPRGGIIMTLMTMAMMILTRIVKIVIQSGLMFSYYWNVLFFLLMYCIHKKQTKKSYCNVQYNTALLIPLVAIKTNDTF